MMTPYPREEFADAMTPLVAAGEPEEVVYADPPPTLSFKKARAKIFAKDMTIEKLSELMGGDTKDRIVNWKYVARMRGTDIHSQYPLPPSLPPIQALPSKGQETDTELHNRRSAHPRIPPTRGNTLPSRRRTLDRLRRRAGPAG